MRSFKKLLASLIARATKRMGIAACGCASMYGGYQTKEPKNIYKNYDKHYKAFINSPLNLVILVNEVTLAGK